MRLGRSALVVSRTGNRKFLECHGLKSFLVCAKVIVHHEANWWVWSLGPRLNLCLPKYVRLFSVSISVQDNLRDSLANDLIYSVSPLLSIVSRPFEKKGPAGGDIQTKGTRLRLILLNRTGHPQTILPKLLQRLSSSLAFLVVAPASSKTPRPPN